jgi:hypothetical protein
MANRDLVVNLFSVAAGLDCACTVRRGWVTSRATVSPGPRPMVHFRHSTLAPPVWEWRADRKSGFLMKINKVHVDGQSFILAAEEDVPALKALILTSLQGSGSAFVDFESVGRGLISVLITPSLPVRFEVIDRTEDQMKDWESNPPVISDEQSLDLDRYLEHY